LEPVAEPGSVLEPSVENNMAASEMKDGVSTSSKKQGAMASNKVKDLMAPTEVKDTLVSSETLVSNKVLESSKVLASKDETSPVADGDSPDISLTFSDVIKLIQNGKPIPGIKKIDIQPTETDPSPSVLERKAKPWES